MQYCPKVKLTPNYVGLKLSNHVNKFGAAAVLKSHEQFTLVQNTWMDKMASAAFNILFSFKVKKILTAKGSKTYFWPWPTQDGVPVSLPSLLCESKP